MPGTRFAIPSVEARLDRKVFSCKWRLFGWNLWTIFETPIRDIAVVRRRRSDGYEWFDLIDFAGRLLISIEPGAPARWADEFESAGFRVEGDARLSLNAVTKATSNIFAGIVLTAGVSILLVVAYAYIRSG